MKRGTGVEEEVEKIWRLAPSADAKAMDAALAAEAQAGLGQDLASVPLRRLFLPGAHGGDGFQSIEHTAPAAQAASWHLCMPHILRRLGLASSSALSTLSPWARSYLPQATALKDDTAQIGDKRPWVKDPRTSWPSL